MENSTYKKQELLTLREHLSLPQVFSWFFYGVRVAHLLGFCVVLLCIFAFGVPCCDVRYDFGWKRCSVCIYLQLFVGGFISYLRYLYLFRYGGLQHMLCCVFALFFVVLCTLCCQFLWILFVLLSLRYYVTFNNWDLNLNTMTIIVRKNKDVNEHERLSNYKFIDKLNYCLTLKKYGELCRDNQCSLLCRLQCTYSFS